MLIFMRIRNIPLVCCLLLLTTSLVAQQQNPDELKTEADTLFAGDQNANALDLYRQAFELEMKQASPRPLFLGECTEGIGNCHFFLDSLDLAFSGFEDALDYYREVAEKEKIRILLKSISDYYLLVKILDKPLKRDPLETEVTEEVYFRVEEVLDRESERVEAVLDAGSYDGVFEGGKGKALGVNTEQYKDRNNLTLGNAVVDAVTSNTARVTVILADTTDSSTLLLAGDMILLPARIKKRDYTGVLHDLTLMHIFFHDMESKPIYAPRQILTSIDPDLERDILEIMKEDVIETARFVRSQSVDNPEWNKPAEKGRFIGKALLEALDNTTPDDIRAFLKYVNSFPLKYIGRNWKINETYATWVIYSTPIGSEDLRDELTGITDDARFLDKLNAYMDDFERGEFFTHWQMDAERFGNLNRFEEAYRISNLLFRVAGNLQNDEYLAWAWFVKAKIQEDEMKFDEALISYKEAEKLFDENGLVKGKAFCINNSAGLLKRLDRYPEALYAFEKAYQAKLEWARSDSSSEMNKSLAITLEGKAATLYDLGHFTEAIESYHQSNAYYVRSATLDGLKSQVNNYKWIGKSFEKLGEYEKAIQYYNERKRVFGELGDKAGEADVLDDIAYLCFEIGKIDTAGLLYENAYRIKMDLGDKNGAGFSMASIGQVNWTLGKFEEAIRSHQLGLKLRKEADNRSGQAYSYTKLGGLYNESGDPKKAIENFSEALEIYTALDQQKEISEVYEELGSTFRKVKDYPQAIKNYRVALGIEEQLSDNYRYASTLTELGNVYYDDKKYELADSCYNRSLSIQETTGDKPGMIHNLINRGMVAQYFLFDMEKAAGSFDTALSIAREIKNDRQIAFCKASLGRLYSAKGDEQSIDLLREALELYRGMGDKGEEIQLQLDMGYHFTSRGDFMEAEKHYTKASVMAGEINDRSKLAFAFSSLGELSRYKGEYQKAFEMEEKSLEISKEVENTWAMAGSYLNFGNIHNALGEYEQAVTSYQTADSLYVILDNELGRAAPMNNIGTIYFWQGNFKPALEQFMKALDIHEKANAYPETIALMKTNIGELYLEEKQYEEAGKWLQESLAEARKGGFNRQVSSTLITLAKLNITAGHYDEAEKNLTDGRKILRETHEANLEREMNYLFGKLYYNMEEFELSKVHLTRSIQQARQTGSKKHLWESLFTLSQVHKEEQNLDSAILALEESIEIIEYLKNKVTGGEEARKIFASGEAKVKAYELMVEMLLQQGKTEEALAYLERGNNENLKSKFKDMEVNFAKQSKNDALQQEKELKKRVDAVNEEIEKERAKPVAQQNEGLIEKLEEIQTVAQSEYLSFVNRIIREEPTLRNHFSKSENPLNFRSQKRFIPDDVAVLLYLAADEYIYIFAGTCDSVFAKVVEMKKSRLEMKLFQLYSMLKKPGETVSETGEPPFVDLSRELYSVLITPVEEEIKGKKRLAIIPNGMLYYLPFQVLIHPEGPDIHYLRDDYSVFYSNRLSYLTSPYLVDETHPRLLAVGNADETLPYAEVEVNQLKEIYPDAQILLRSEATKDKVLSPAGEYNILHFATHGILDYNDFENSYLVLAADPATGDDGRFRIDEIYGISNIDQYQMVTLSACETAVTMKMLEGWPITTASAFLEAGVPTVIASLWSVDDEATSILMEKFYENLQSMDKLEALHRAQQYLASIDKYKHPFFWAPFLLVGYWR